MKRLALPLGAVLVIVVAAVAVRVFWRPSPFVPFPAPATSVAPATSSAGPHIALIVMENKESSAILGNSRAPYINRLARSGAVATNMFGVTHPSLPNYLALAGGSTYGISSDCTGCSAKGANLGTQLSAAGISWKAYAEGYPGSCYLGSSYGAYAKKHVPFLYFASITGNKAMCAHIVPLSQLTSDETKGTVPSFAWITPNLCNDMHSCSVATGDNFLASLVPTLVRALGPNGIVIITWDEGSTSLGCCGDLGGGHIPFIMAGAGVKAGASTAKAYDHYAVLGFIESEFKLKPLGKAAERGSESLRELVH